MLKKSQQKKAHENGSFFVAAFDAGAICTGDAGRAVVDRKRFYTDH